MADSVRSSALSTLDADAPLPRCRDPAAIVELAGKAVLRGRGIRCRLCGEKGATLGCMTTCPVSLHLPCAAKGGGLLLVSRVSGSVEGGGRI